MSLASRLCGFFLIALAAMLGGFSLALYLLAASYLHHQVDDRLDAALATLAAAAEVGPQGVEWEPDERDLGLGRDTGADQIRWIVRDDLGRPVDQSANLNPRRFLDITPARFSDGVLRDRDGRTWEVKTRRVAFNGQVSPGDRAGGESDGWTSDEAAPPRLYPCLTCIALAPLGPTEATLRWLPWTLTGLSAALWLVSALAGRRLCRRALAPLTRMSAAARESDAADPSARLPLPGTRDELEDLGLAFNGLLDRLHEALERQRRFTGDASHQLRTPLTGLLSQVDVALRHDRSADEYRRVLGVVRGKGAQLRQIIESLLFLARTEAESGRPELETVDLAAWLPEHLRGWSSHPRAVDLQLALDDKGPLAISAHPLLLSQLLDNLLENAFKYSRPGSPVVIRLVRGNGSALLTVEDRGYGLSADDRARIFQPFYRTPAARSRGQGGVGLGLAVADRIVKVFGGTIRVASEPGVGSRFTVVLPATPGDEAIPVGSHADLHDGPR